MAGLEVEAVAPAAPPFDDVVVGAHRRRSRRIRTPTACACARVDVGARRAAADRVRRAERGGRHAGAVRARRREAARRPDDQARRRCAASNRAACCARRRSSASSDDAAACSRSTPIARARHEPCARRSRSTTRCITLKLTPNRADCLSIAGIAREVAAITGAPLDAAGTRAIVAPRIDDARACASRTPRRVPALLRRALIDGIDATRADAGVDEAAPRALAASARSPRWSTSPTT